ncbi:MAG: PD40 domain-containing protein [Pirellulaceae bacterium]|nr:PD40 domain-containing protein [Pirellulaceae bacterium]
MRFRNRYEDSSILSRGTKISVGPAHGLPCILALGMVSTLVAGTTARGADDSAVGVLAQEVAGKGWIVFAAHPKEIDGGEIIKASQRRGQFDLYLSRPDGSQLQNITNTEQYSEFGGRFSPDGTKLLYRRLPPGASINHDLWGEVGQAFVADADGSNPVSQGEAGEFPWASFCPDMKQIACLYRKERKIRIFDFATKRLLKQLPAEGVYQQLFWSPDGRRLVGTANVVGRRWNVVSVDIQTESQTVLTRALNCTPDWFQGDPQRVIYSNRNPALFPGKYNNYGLTMLMWASVDGKTRKLIYGDAWKHCYFGCTSPDDEYVLFSDDISDTIVAGEMHVLRMADTPIIPEGIKQIRLLHPGCKDGPVLDLKLKNGIPLRGFEPHWTYADVLDGNGISP